MTFGDGFFGFWKKKQQPLEMIIISPPNFHAGVSAISLRDSFFPQKISLSHGHASASLRVKWVENEADEEKKCPKNFVP